MLRRVMTDSSADISNDIQRLLDIMAQLRNPDGGCPWDLEQDFASIAPYTVEEAYEVADAIAHHDLESLKDELGDLLLQVVFHARMAEEEQAFDFGDVVAAISDKMIRRHPHVFGDRQADRAEHVKGIWEERKAEERSAKANGAETSALDGVALALPALIRAEKLQKRAARVRFDWPDPTRVFDKIDEELTEIKEEMANGAPPERIKDEVGDLLFTVVNLARHLGVDAEQALDGCNRKFERRFRAIEKSFADGDKPMAEATLDEMEAAWQEAKRSD